MTTFRALQPFQARASLAERLGTVADRVRDRVSVRFGMNAYRVFLVWTRSGISQESERGDGKERLFARVELLPVPRVSDLSGLIRSSWSVGTVPAGSVRVDQISMSRYTSDQLQGKSIPFGCPGGLDAEEPLPPFVDFFYEVVEDGRGDNPAERRRFRLMAEPYRDPARATWIIALEKADRDLDRNGQPITDGFPVIR